MSISIRVQRIHADAPCRHMMFVIHGIIDKNCAIIKTAADAIFYICKTVILVKKAEQIRAISYRGSISQPPKDKKCLLHSAL